MLEALEWNGKNEKGSAGGQTKSFGNLTYIDIRGAGHMVSTSLLGQLAVWGAFGADNLRRAQVPLDKPKEALWMIKNWLVGESF